MLLGTQYIKSANQTKKQEIRIIETNLNNTMNSIVHEFVNDITNNAPTGNKLSVINYIQSKYNLARDGKVYHNKFFAVRFSFSGGSIRILSGNAQFR